MAQSTKVGEKIGKHLNTAVQSADSVKAKAVVTHIRSESPTVRGITLLIDTPQFSFKAGQWVDFFIPGIETIAGFSMYSSPKQLAEKRTMELGIQFSEWPPTFWVHDQCKINSTVEVRVGGNKYYAPETGDGSYDLLLVAGGIGINPMASMFLHANDLHRAYQKKKEGHRPGKILLLFSARTREELLYKSMLDSVSTDNSELEVRYYTTRERPAESSDVNSGRITAEVLKSALETLNTSSSLRSFVCGPTSMIDDVERDLLMCGLSQNQITYEKWW